MLLRLVCVVAGHVVRGVQRVAHQHGVGARGVQLAVGLVGDLVSGQLGAAAQPERRVETRLPRRDGADGGWIVRSVHVSLAVFVVRPQADVKSAQSRAKLPGAFPTVNRRHARRPPPAAVRSARSNIRSRPGLRACARRGAARAAGTPAATRTTRRARRASGCGPSLGCSTHAEVADRGEVRVGEDVVDACSCAAPGCRRAPARRSTRRVLRFFISSATKRVDAVDSCGCAPPGVAKLRVAGTSPACRCSAKNACHCLSL